jgi:undecaprenyl-diphosphatase
MIAIVYNIFLDQCFEKAGFAHRDKINRYIDQHFPFYYIMIPALLHLDNKLFFLINSHHAGFFDVFFYLITWLGNGWVITPILLAIAFIKVPRARLWFFIVVSAAGMIASGLINSKIKDITHRPRPVSYFASSPSKADTVAALRPHFKVHVVGAPLASRAFPSGHSNTAFSAATLVAVAFGGWYWLAFVPAVLVGYSRVYIGAHFPLDVVAGGLLGILIMFVFNIFLRRSVLSLPFSLLRLRRREKGTGEKG